MAQNEVKLTFKVSDDGTLKLISDKAKKAKKATDDLTRSTDGLANSRNRYNKAEKGVGGLGANSTKNFAKMNQTLGGSSGLVAAYATLAANAFALTAALNALSRAAAFQQLANGLSLVGSQAGLNLPYVADQLKEITNGALSTEQALRATAVATTSGFSTAQLTQLTKVAKGASVALGRDLGDALDRLVRGTAKLEPEILDELGIIVRLDDATEKYAAKVGKTVGALTTFERQQAFLNATIEQGSKKYGALSERLDTNPYEKLAAAFNDLTKSILGFTNTALGPIAEFLSQNKFALFGALVAFTTSISKALLPSLQSMATQAKEIHEGAARAAKRSGKIINKSYEEQRQKVISVATSAKVLPASFEKALPALKKNSLSVKELQGLLTNLKKSEQLRAAANSRYTGQKLADAQKELASIKALRVETEALIASESKRMVSNVTGVTASKRSRTGRRTENAINVVQNSGAIGGLGAALKNASNEFKDFTKTSTKAYATMSGGQATIASARAGFIALGGAARVFGAALLNAIPFVGQIIFLFSVLTPIVKDFFGIGEKSKIIDEVTESFKSFNEVGKELARTLLTAGTEGEKTFARLKAGVGIMQQVENAFQSYIDTRLQEAGETINKNLEKEIDLRQKIAHDTRLLASAEKSLADMRARGVDNRAIDMQAAEVQRLTHRLNQNKTALEENQEASKGVLDRAKSVDNAAGIAILTRALSELRSQPVLSEEMKDQMSVFEQALIDVTQNGKSVKQALEDIEKAKLNDQNIVNSIETISESLGRLNAEATKLKDKARTEFDGYVKEFQGVENKVKAISGDRNLLRDFLGTEDGKITQEMVQNAAQAFGKLEGMAGAFIKNADGTERFFAFTQVSDYDTVLGSIREKFEQNNDIIAQSAANAARLTNEARQLGEAAKYNSTITKLQVGLENEAKEAKIAGLRATAENLIASGGLEETADRRRDIALQIAALEAEISDSAQEQFRIVSAEIANAQRLLQFKQKQQAAEKAILDNRIASAREAMEVSRARTGSNVSAADELALQKRFLEEQKAAEDAAAQAKLQAIGLEFVLLNAQLNLEKSKIDRLEKEGKITKEVADQSREAIEGVRQAAIASTTAQANAVISTRDRNNESRGNAITTSEIDVVNEAIKTAEDRALNAANVLREAGRERAALLQEEAVNQGRIALLESQRAELMKDPAKNAQAIAEKNLEIETAILEKLKNQAAQRQLMVEQAERVGGSTAGAFAQFSQGFAGQLGEGGAFSGDETATMTEKVQALRQMTSGMIAELQSLGPEGEVVAQVAQGALNISEAFGTFAEAAEGSAERTAAAFQVASAAINAIAGIMRSQNQAAIAEIDNQIAAEKKRDGKSQQSQAKIAAMEKKKEQMQRKAFEQNKKMQMAQVIASTAMSIASNMAAASAAAAQAGLAAPAVFAGYLGLMNGITLAMGAAQLAVIASTSYQGGGSLGGGGGGTPSQISIGERRNSVDLAKSKSARGELAYFRGESGAGGPEAFRATGAFTGMKYRANGGNTAFMVGEQGPELFVPDRPGTIIPNDETQPVAPTNVTFSINTIDASGVEDMLVAQRGNIIGMIRQAANSYGQDFVEEVDTSVFTQSSGGVSRY